MTELSTYERNLSNLLQLATKKLRRLNKKKEKDQRVALLQAVLVQRLTQTMRENIARKREMKLKRSAGEEGRICLIQDAQVPSLGEPNNKKQRLDESTL